MNPTWRKMNFFVLQMECIKKWWLKFCHFFVALGGWCNTEQLAFRCKLKFLEFESQKFLLFLEGYLFKMQIHKFCLFTFIFYFYSFEPINLFLKIFKYCQERICRSNLILSFCNFMVYSFDKKINAEKKYFMADWSNFERKRNRIIITWKGFYFVWQQSNIGESQLKYCFNKNELLQHRNEGLEKENNEINYSLVINPL